MVARTHLAQQVRSAYVAGQGGSMALMLSQQEPDRIGRLLTYFDYLNRASARGMDAIHAEIAAVSAEQARVAAELDKLQGLQATRKRALAELEADRAGRQRAVAARSGPGAQERSALPSSETGRSGPRAYRS